MLQQATTETILEAMAATSASAAAAAALTTSDNNKLKCICCFWVVECLSFPCTLSIHCICVQPNCSQHSSQKLYIGIERAQPRNYMHPLDCIYQHSLSRYSWFLLVFICTHSVVHLILSLFSHCINGQINIDRFERRMISFQTCAEQYIRLLGTVSFILCANRSRQR